MNFTDYTLAMERLGVYPKNDEAFKLIQPQVIAYAENRIYREGDFLATVVRDATSNLTAGSRELVLPSTGQHFVTVEQINVITPVGAVTADAGTRSSLIPVRRDWLDMTWGSVGVPAVPAYMAQITDQEFIVGPWPDQSYRFEVVGTVRPTPLSITNPTTFLSLYLPDVFVAASMIFVTGYQQNFGGQSEDPQAGLSWEQQYKELMASTSMEEMRKKWMNAPAPGPAS